MPDSPVKLRVLAWPNGASVDQNPYAEMTYVGFDRDRAEVDGFYPSMVSLPRADVFHIHWPEGIFWGKGEHWLPVAVAYAINVLRTARAVRKRGGIVALTLHNLHPHEGLTGSRALLFRRFQKALLAQTNLLISLSGVALDLYRDQHPRAADIPAVVIPHPHYRKAYPNARSRSACRETFGFAPEHRVIGIVGAVRKSKAVAEAAEVFRAVAEPAERLLIAGACEDDLWAEILHAQGGDERIVLRRGHMDDASLNAALTACDIVLNNQASTLNSATALLALSANRPLIAPQAGSLIELAEAVGPEWVALFPPPLTGESLRASIDSLAGARRGSEAPLESFDPGQLSQRLLAVFEQALSKGPDVLVVSSHSPAV